jgi:hypothetical protein
MSERVLERRWRLAVRLTVAALVWSLGLLLAALFVAVYKGQTVSSGTAGITLTTRTFVQVHGLGALILVIIPPIGCLVAGGALWHRRHRRSGWSGPVAWAAAAVLAIEAILGIATFGAFVLPVVGLLALSIRLIPGPVPPVAEARSAVSPAIDR